MLSILIWLSFGFLVGILAKIIHPGDEPVGCLSTVVIGVVGSFIGGGINWILGLGNHPFHPSGFLMSIVGGVVCCAAWRWYNLKTASDGPKSFFTGKKLR